MTLNNKSERTGQQRSYTLLLKRLCTVSAEEEDLPEKTRDAYPEEVSLGPGESPGEKPYPGTVYTQPHLRHLDNLHTTPLYDTPRLSTSNPTSLDPPYPTLTRHA